MSGARLSIFTWAIYMLALGLGLALIPNQIVDLLGIEPTSEAWIRVVGVVAMVAGTYYLGAAIHRARWLFWWSVPVRIASGVGLAVLAVTESVWQLWIFAILDVLAAGWTFTSLRPAAVDATPDAGAAV